MGVFAAVFLWFGLFAWWGVDWHHDGIMLAPVKQLLEQRVLFKEVFCQYGPLSIWIPCIPAAIFGAETIVLRLTTVFFYALTALLGAKIWGRFVQKPFLWIWYFCFFSLCSFYATYFHPWSSVYALFFMLLGVELQLCFFEKERLREKMIFWSGACAGAAFLCRTPCGVVAFTAGLAVLLLDAAAEKGPGRFKGALHYSGGMAFILGLFALYLTAAGAWRDYWQQCFSAVFKFAITRNGGNFPGDVVKNVFHPLDPMGGNSWVFILIPILTGATLLILFRNIWRDRKDGVKKHLPLLAVLMLAVGSLHQYYPVPCQKHFWWAALPAFGVYALTVQYAWNWKRDLKIRLLLLLLLTIPFVPVCCNHFAAATDTLRKMRQAAWGDLPGMRGSLVDKNDLKFCREIYDIYNSLPPEIKQRGVLNNTPDGYFNCLLPGPPKYIHPMFVNWHNSVYPDYFNFVGNFIFKEQPLVLSTMVEVLPGYKVIFARYYQDKKFYFFEPIL